MQLAGPQEIILKQPILHQYIYCLRGCNLLYTAFFFTSIKQKMLQFTDSLIAAISLLENNTPRKTERFGSNL